MSRSGDTCAYNKCVDKSSGSSSNLAGAIGGAVGGIGGVVVAVGVIYWFWWKPRGLAASRKRYSEYAAKRKSKAVSMEMDKKTEAVNPTDPVGHNRSTSVHLNIGTGAGDLPPRISLEVSTPSRSVVLKFELTFDT